MRLIATIAGRSLLRRPARTVFSIVGVAFGIAIAVGVDALDYNTVLGLSLPGLNDWRPELEVRPAQGVADPRAELAGIPGVMGVSAVFQNEVVARRADGTVPLTSGAQGRVVETATEPTRARLLALEAKAIGALDALRIEVGRPLEASAREREVLIGGALAEALAVAPGDTILLARPARAPRQACVDGEVRTLDDAQAAADAPIERPFKVAGVLAREKLGKKSEGMIAVVDFRWGQELFTGTPVDPRFWIRQDPKVDIERLSASLASSFSYELNKSVIVGAAANERAFRNGVRMAGLLALVLGLYVIFHTLSMSLVERVREVATLHALGCTRGQVTRIFVSEAIAISLAAAVLGLAGGLALAKVLLRAGITTLGSGHPMRAFGVPWADALALVALGVGVALLGSIWPLLRARRASPTAALRGEEALGSSAVRHGFHLFAALLLAVLLPGLYFTIVPVVGAAQGVLVGAILAAVGILALLVVVPLLVPSLLGILSALVALPMQRLWTLSGRLAARTMREGRARIGVASAAIALVAAAFVGLKGMTASLRGEIEVWAEHALVDKVYLGNLPGVQLDALRKQLERYPGIVAIESGGARSYVPFLLLGMSTAELARFGPCRDDASLARELDEGGVILSVQLARHLGYAVRDRVHVANAAGNVQDLTVIAISDAYGYFPHPDERLYGVVSERFTKRAFCLDAEQLTECAVVLAKDADPEVVRVAVREMLPDHRGLKFETGRGLLAAHLADIDRDFRLFDIILGLTAALAGLGVLNGLLLSALERKKELGVLKALGATRRQIAGMVLCESTVVGLLGGFVGTALGAGLTPLIVRALEGLSGLDLPERGAGAWLLFCPAGALAVSLLASLYPVWRMNRMDPVAAVRTG